MVVDNDADAVSLDDLNRRARSTAVETPEIDRFVRCDLLSYRLSNEMKYFYSVIYREQQIFQIR